MLHIISTSAEHEVLFARIATGDTLLFIADAVLCLQKKSQVAKTILLNCQRLKCYALQADLLARGLALEDILSEISVVDYQGFVTLTTENEVIKTWR